MEKCLFAWQYYCFSKTVSSFRRCPPSKRNLIIGGVCFVYLFFVVSQVGQSLPYRDRGADKNNYKRGLSLGTNEAHPNTEDLPTGEYADSLRSVVPTRCNVVYITLKSKRLKPAIIRGTVRPKLRRKVRRLKVDNVGFTHNKLGPVERDEEQRRTFGNDLSWKEIRNIDYSASEGNEIFNADFQTNQQASSIRIYSKRAPPWFSTEDINAMRFLSDGKVSRIKELSYRGSSPFLLFESTTNESLTNDKDVNIHPVCQEHCGIIRRPVDTSEVFAFHLDRVLGLNRTLPAVSRRFNFLPDGQPRPVVSWDPSLYPENLLDYHSAVKLTWGQYQNSLKQRCWHKNVTPKPDSGCSPIHHYEWSKLALFDFLLQIYNRLDRSCCGFKPRQEDLCVELGHHAECEDKDRIALTNIVHRGHDPRHMVFTNNKGFFDRDEDNLDFKLLEGIKELPEQAIGVLRSRRLREKLLQSLFLDQVYWESQGGRQGIEKLIDVIERRVIVLLTYINAHGIKLIAMNI